MNEPHRNIQRALLEARRAGATRATVTHEGASAKMEDDRPGQSPYVQHFDTRTHPSEGPQWYTGVHMESHIAPEGLETFIVTHPRRRHRIPSVGENVLAERTSPDGRHRVYITDQSATTPTSAIPTTFVMPDGTSVGERFWGLSARPRYMYSESGDPGSPVEARCLSVIVEVKDEKVTDRIPVTTLLEIDLIAATLIGEYLESHPLNDKGRVWPTRYLRDIIEAAIHRTGENIRIADPPSISQYRVRNTDGSWTRMTGITPDNAVSWDYEANQAGMVARAIENSDTKNLTLVKSQDRSLPALRLVRATVKNLDGSVDVYIPGHLQTEIPRSRAERVKSIRLAFELEHPMERWIDEFTLESDLYVDNHREHYVMLVTEGSNLSTADLRGIFGDVLTEDLSGLPEVTQDMAQDIYGADDIFEELVCSALVDEGEFAARKALWQIATLAEAMKIEQYLPDGQKSMSATSPSGKVKVTLMPNNKKWPWIAPAPPFVRLPPYLPFLGIDGVGFPKRFESSEELGAIVAGHLLRYSSYDGKMETFQPEGAGLFERVHPYTTRMVDTETMDEVRESQDDTSWLVVAAEDRQLFLAPISNDRVDELIEQYQ